MTDAAASPEIVVAPERTGVIQWQSLPRRIVTLWLPLSCFVVVLLFPFYWMAITALKSNEELYNFKEFNPLWVHSPTLANINRLLFETDYPRWLMVTMGVAICSTIPVSRSVTTRKVFRCRGSTPYADSRATTEAIASASSS